MKDLKVRHVSWPESLPVADLLYSIARSLVFNRGEPSPAAAVRRAAGIVGLDLRDDGDGVFAEVVSELKKELSHSHL